MNQKGALELSVNAIVILIIALAILGLVIGFAVNKFNELGAQIVPTENTAEATSQNGITLPGGKQRFNVAIRGGLLMEVGVYATDIGTAAMAGSLKCVGDTASEKAFALGLNCPTMALGDSKKCSAEITSTLTAPDVGTEKACTLEAYGQSKTVFLTAQ